jgi:hypothetical protein
VFFPGADNPGVVGVQMLVERSCSDRPATLDIFARAAALVAGKIVETVALGG